MKLLISQSAAVPVTLALVNSELAKKNKLFELTKNIHHQTYMMKGADADLPRAIEHIEDVLTAELGVPFVLTRGDSK